MITEADLIPGTIFSGFASCHHGRHGEQLMILAYVETSDRNTQRHGGPLYYFIFLPDQHGVGFGGDHSRGRVGLTLKECLEESSYGNGDDRKFTLERVGTLTEALEKLGWFPPMEASTFRG